MLLRIYFMATIIALIPLLSGCSATEAQLDGHATRVAGEIYASLEVDADEVNIADELTPSEIYAQIAPAIAIIETE